jgi:hypothetical protein
VKPLEMRARILELEAELQRVSLAAKLQRVRRRSDASLLLPALASAVGWLLRSRRKWLGMAWVVLRTLRK